MALDIEQCCLRVGGRSVDEGCSPEVKREVTEGPEFVAAPSFWRFFANKLLMGCWVEVAKLMMRSVWLAPPHRRRQETHDRLL